MSERVGIVLARLESKFANVVFIILLCSQIINPSSCIPSFTVSICFAKHVNDKAARWAKSKRPRKSRASDINRKPIIYEVHSMTKPAEYSISDAPAVPMAKPARTEN